MSNYIDPDHFIVGPGDIKRVHENWVEGDTLPDGYHQLFREEKPDSILVFGEDASEGDDPIKVTEYVCEEPSHNEATNRWEQVWTPVVIDPWIPLTDHLPEEERSSER